VAVYGNRQLSLFFFATVETNSAGFIFKGKQYAWGDIKSVEIKEEPRIPLHLALTAPCCRVTLKNGATIQFSNRVFEKRDEPVMQGYLSAFDELAALFRKNCRYNKTLQPTAPTDGAPAER
jgi:hypothetical protein